MTQVQDHNEEAVPVDETSLINLDCVLRWPSEKARNWMHQFVRQVIATDSVVALIGIGSAIRPQASTSTDLDLVLIYRDERPDFESPPVDVDVRVFRLNEVDERIAAGNDLLGWTVRYGQLVFERDHIWSDIVARWQSMLPLPPASVALERGLKTQQRVRDLLAVGDEDAALEQAISMLTHYARARLIEAGVYPASRPELPGQLQQIGEMELAHKFAQLLQGNALVQPSTWQSVDDELSHRIGKAA